jgi:hypothetical protein
MSGYSPGATREATSRFYDKAEETDSTKVSKGGCAQVDQEKVDPQGYREDYAKVRQESDCEGHQEKDGAGVGQEDN